MSAFQLKNRSISAVPRLVMEYKWSSPGTMLTASSSGLVTVTSIWSMGNDAVVDADHDAREIGIRENRHRDGERQVNAHRHQREDHENDRLAVAGGPVRRLVRGTAVEGSKGRSFLLGRLVFLLSGTTSGCTSSSASGAVASTTLTLPLSSTPMPPTTTTSSRGITPVSTCTSFPWRTPSWTGRL